MAPDPDIQASLLEAQQYERRQILRRRGLVCLQYGLLALVFTLFGLEIVLERGSAFEFFVIAGVALGSVALNIAIRRKPLWNLVFRQYAGPAPAPWRYLLMAAIALAMLAFPLSAVISDSVT